jgi:hypothetical protein
LTEQSLSHNLDATEKRVMTGSRGSTGQAVAQLLAAAEEAVAAGKLEEALASLEQAQRIAPAERAISDRLAEIRSTADPELLCRLAQQHLDRLSYRDAVANLTAAVSQGAQVKGLHDLMAQARAGLHAHEALVRERKISHWYKIAPVLALLLLVTTLVILVDGGGPDPNDPIHGTPPTDPPGPDTPVSDAPVSDAPVTDPPVSEPEPQETDTPGPDTPGPDTPGPDTPGPDTPGPVITQPLEDTTEPPPRESFFLSCRPECEIKELSKKERNEPIGEYIGIICPKRLELDPGEYSITLEPGNPEGSDYDGRGKILEFIITPGENNNISIRYGTPTEIIGAKEVENES